MSMNLTQVYAINPITTIGNNDLLYVDQNQTTDAGIKGSDLKAQLAPLTTKGDLYTFSTANTRLAVGTINGQILQVNNATATGLVWSTPAYPLISGVAGKVLRSDGTHNVYSTFTIADTFTANNLLYASAANTVTGLATGNDGVLITSGAGVPSISSTLPSVVQGNITGLGTITTGTWNGSIITGTYGGTGVNNGASTITLGGSLTTVGAFTASFTFTNNTNVTFPTSGTLATSTSVLNFNNVTSTPVVLVTNNGYVVNNGAALVTFQLPATAAIGDRFIIVGHDSGGWQIAQVGVNQHIHLGSSTSTTGLAGFISSTDGNDCVELVCTATNNEFTVRNVIGNITVS